MNQTVKQQGFLRVYGFYTHQKGWDMVIYLGKDPDPVPAVQIRPDSDS
jgi:hypothetical protein